MSANVECAAKVLGDLARRDEPIGARTTYRVGGCASLFVEIATKAALAKVVAAVQASAIDLLVLGRGSNLLIADAGFEGLCVTLAGEFATLELDSSRQLLHGGGGLELPVLARRSAAAGIAGLEWAVGIPGSVGGAVRMNAGGHGGETAAHLEAARVVDLRSGVDELRPGERLGLGYRRSALGPHELVLSARLRGHRGDKVASAAMIAEIVAWRRQHQPGGRNAGSIFTNPEGDAAGRIVEAAGLKGMRIGGAQVSIRHANFIQVDAGGSADDVHRLIREVQRLVLERLGVELSCEVRFAGAFS